MPMEIIPPNLQYSSSVNVGAKVNLQLGVGPLREDGYHELVSVFHSLNLVDEVHLFVDPDAEGNELFIDEDTEGRPFTGSHVTRLSTGGYHSFGVPTDSSNLAWKAVDLVAAAYIEREKTNRFSTLNMDRVPNMAIHLWKWIPTAGGMAGGSADAAGLLYLANKLYSEKFNLAPLERSVLFELAAQLGSDVPFALLGGTALGTGRGEKLTTMLCRGTFHWAIITSEGGLCTPKVFQEFDRLNETRDFTPSFDSRAVAQAVAAGNAEALATAMVNDLQPAALSLRPDLRKVLNVGEQAGALRGMVSGSGPTCIFLCADSAIADDVIAEVTAEIPGTRGIVTTSPGKGIDPDV